MVGSVSDLGVTATVFFTSDGMPTTVTDGAREELDTLALPHEDINIVSEWTLHVALYALQNPTRSNIAHALELIGSSGDVEDAVDSDTLLPLPVEKPHGWTP